MSSSLRVGVIGAGWAGELHMEAFAAAQGAEVVAVCSRTRSVAEKVAARHGVTDVFDDVSQLLDQDLDVVSIATPPATHRDLTLAAVAHGAHVLCDKPTGLTGPQASEGYHAAEAAGLRHASGYIWRNDPAILHLRALLADGAIGTVLDVNTRCALGAPVLPMTWMYDDHAGGGALMQHGGHVIDRVRWLLGDEVVSVSGETLHDVSEAEVGPRFHNVMAAFGWAARREQDKARTPLPTAPVTADTGYRFNAVLGSGARAQFWESWHSPSTLPDVVELYGTEGTLIWAGAAGITLVRRGRQPELIEIPGSSEAGSRDLKDLRAVGQRLWARFVQSFVDDIRGSGGDSYPTLYDGWKVQEVIDAVRASAASASWEKC